MNVLLLSHILVLALIRGESKTIPQAQGNPRTFGNFRPAVKNSFKIFTSTTTEFLKGDQVKAGVQFFAQDTKVNLDQVKVSSFHTSKHNGVTHVYLQQTLDGIPVANGVGNINVLKNGQVHSLASSFFTGQKRDTSNLNPTHSATDAVTALANLLKLEAPSNPIELSQKNSPLQQASVNGVPFTVAPVQSELNYIQTQNGLRLVRKINVEMIDNYYVALVDADSNEVLSLTDYVSDASYNVIPFGLNDPREGDLSLVVNPEDTVLGSPKGWHYSGPLEYSTDTTGNNAIAQSNPDGGYDYHNNPRPVGDRVDYRLVFNYTADFTQEPTDYVEASTVQLFYMTNIIHDVFYRYGFTEAAGNFQEYNFGRGGDGSDAVLSNTQDGSGTNNANFLTPPDGANGRMRMYIFTHENEELPWKDSSYDTSIVIHEYLHGISNRLTGGRSDTGCLATGESQGMGEGWGDIFGVMFQSNEETTRNRTFHMGTYVLQNNPEIGPGIRKYPYTSDMEINPSTYAYTIKPDYDSPHRKGEVWCAMLNEVYWNLVEKHGFQNDWYKTNASETEEGKLGGNVIFAQLLIDGMKLQPCTPTFVQARDAIIEADGINNNGENFDELWIGFAKRGLGIHAEAPGKEDFTLPNNDSGVSMNSASFALALFSFVLAVKLIFESI